MTIYLYIKTHKITGLKYLGQTKNNPYRYNGSGKYWLRHLNKHGDDHDTDILMECQTKEEVSKWGLYYSELYDVVESPEWANLKPENGHGGGIIHTEETRAKISEANKGRTHSSETRAKMSAAARNISPETRAKMSEAAKKRGFSDNIRSPEARAKISEASRNRIVSPETRAKLSAAKRNASPEYRAKIAEANRKRNTSPEHRAKVSEANKGRTYSPETRAKISAALIARHAARRFRLANLEHTTQLHEENLQESCHHNAPQSG